MHSRCRGCLEHSYSWNAFAVLSMKCTNNEIYIVLISLHIIMHWRSSWTQQQHWNYRQTASQGCSTSCLCWLCDRFKPEYWILQMTYCYDGSSATFIMMPPLFILYLCLVGKPCVVSYGHSPHCWSVDETFAFWNQIISETPVHSSILFYALQAHANAQWFTGQQS